MALLDGAKGAGTATLADTVALATPGAGAEVSLRGAGASTLCSVVGAWDGADAGAVGGRLAAPGATLVLTGGSLVG